MGKDISRHYNMDDLQMMQRAQVFHDNFVIDQATFSATFTALATPFEIDFQTAIDEADAIPSGAEYDNQIKVVTEQLNAKLPEAQVLLQKLFTFSDMIWKSKAKTESFGRNLYLKARNSQARMKELLELAHRQAEIAANKTELIAAGFVQADIDALQTLEGEIDTLDAQQEQLLSDRGYKSELRIKAYNKEWEYMQTISQASKVVFVDSPAKIDQYQLYPSSSQSLPKPQNLQAVPNPTDPTVADLSWDTVTGATTYKIYFSEVNPGQPSGSYGEIEEVVGATSTQAPIIPGKQNYWKIKAYGGGLVSAYSDEVSLPG